MRLGFLMLTTGGGVVVLWLLMVVIEAACRLSVKTGSPQFPNDAVCHVEKWTELSLDDRTVIVVAGLLYVVSIDH